MCVCVCVHLSPGKDGTESFEDVGHSPDAREMQEKYLIGEVTEPAAMRIKVCEHMCTESVCAEAVPLYRRKQHQLLEILRVPVRGSGLPLSLCSSSSLPPISTETFPASLCVFCVCLHRD